MNFELNIFSFWASIILPISLILGLIVLLFVTIFKQKKVKNIVFLISIVLCILSLLTTRYQKHLGDCLYFQKNKKEFNSLSEMILQNNSIFQFDHEKVNNINWRIHVEAFDNKKFALREKLNAVKENVLQKANIDEEYFWILYNKLQSFNLSGFLRSENNIEFYKRGLLHSKYGYFFVLDDQIPKLNQIKNERFTIKRIPKTSNWFFYHFDPDIMILE